MKVAIGKHYRPKSFATRSHNREFAAFNIPLDHHELRVQQALLPPARGSMTVHLDWRSYLAWLAGVILAVASVVMLVGAR